MGSQRMEFQRKKVSNEKKILSVSTIYLQNISRSTYEFTLDCNETIIWKEWLGRKFRGKINTPIYLIKTQCFLFIKRKKKTALFFCICMRWWILTECIMVIISLCKSCHYAMLYVNYFAIKLKTLFHKIKYKS